MLALAAILICSTCLATGTTLASKITTLPI